MLDGCHSLPFKFSILWLLKAFMVGPFKLYVQEVLYFTNQFTLSSWTHGINKSLQCTYCKYILVATLCHLNSLLLPLSAKQILDGYTVPFRLFRPRPAHPSALGFHLFHPKKREILSIK